MTSVLHIYMKQIWATWLSSIYSILLLLGNGISSFSFSLKMKDKAVDDMYCTKTNMCYFSWESINSMLSVLFATETCSTIKENNTKEKLFCRGKLPFCWHKSSFCCENWEKLILYQYFFCQHKLQFCLHTSRKTYFCIDIFFLRQKNLNCKGWERKRTIMKQYIFGVFSCIYFPVKTLEMQNSKNIATECLDMW